MDPETKQRIEQAWEAFTGHSEFWSANGYSAFEAAVAPLVNVPEATKEEAVSPRDVMLGEAISEVGRNIRRGLQGVGGGEYSITLKVDKATLEVLDNIGINLAAGLKRLGREGW